MQAYDYYLYWVQQLEKLYPHDEAAAISSWVFEDVLLIRKAHLHYLDKEIGFAEELKLQQLLERLAKGEPVQYVLGYAYFGDLCLKVNCDVLIPRPETEEMVQWIKEDAPAHIGGSTSPRVLDICSGSGCIALALKHAWPGAQVCGMDVSEGAVQVAEANSKQLALPVEWTCMSVLGAEAESWLAAQKFDLLVSNPPYIDEAEKEDMHVNVLGHEPHIALFVPGNDPLLFYRRIMQLFLNHPTARLLFFEISEFRTEALAALCRNSGLAAEIRNDLQGKPRMLMLRKQ